MCARVWCVCVCVWCSVCVWCVCVVVGLVMHHRGLILYGVANGSSPGPCHVVETSHAYTSWNAYISCSMRRTKLLRQLRTTLLSLSLFPAAWHTWPKFKASTQHSVAAARDHLVRIQSFLLVTQCPMARWMVVSCGRGWGSARW